MSKFNLQPNSMVFAGKNVHYAWFIVLAAAVMRLATSGVRTSSSILLPVIVDFFHWSYGAVGIGFSLQWIVSGLFGPTAGWLGDRYGARWTMAIGGVLFLIGMAATGMIGYMGSHLWQFYLFFGVIVSLSMAIFQVPLTVSVTLWIRKSLGVGMGILQSSLGMGPLVWGPIMSVSYKQLPQPTIYSV